QSRRRRHRMHHVRLGRRRQHQRARQAQAQFAVLNLDLGQSSIVEHFGEFAHECGVEAGRLLVMWGSRFPAHALLPSSAARAAASTASKYEVAPKPAITPFAALDTNET